MFNLMLLVSAIIFIVLDFCYLTIIKKYFQNQIQQVQNSPMTIKYLGVVLCYLFLIVALNYFIIKPNRSVNDAFLLGIVIYGVYETTNYALFKNWSIFTVIIDTLWGGTLFAVTTYIINNMRKFI